MLDIEEVTRGRYWLVVDRMKQFGGFNVWQDFTVENIYEWDVWLRQQTVPLTENQKMAGIETATLRQSAVYNYHKLLKAMLNRALKLNKLQSNPYDRMKGSFRRGTHDVVDYLTKEQMQMIERLEPVPGSQYETARDLFVFQMYTGLAYIDTQHFNMKDYRQVDGRWVFVGQRVKTGVPYVSQLLPPVVEVLKRHNWTVPKMNNQRYNQMLKAIGMVIGIERLHSHMGRHTFATWMLSNGSKIENVSKMLGHTDIKMTQRYAEVLAKDVYDDFAMVEKKMKKKKH
jgi:integrase